MDVEVFASETNGYLITRNGRSLLVDCPCTDMAERIAARGLPRPEVILHTQVQEEHCREWASLGDARVYVHSGSEEIARRTEQFFKDCRTVWGLDRQWGPDDRGMEKYGIGGCVTERPPQQPLNVAGVLKPGEIFRWQDVELEVLALPGSGKRSIGLYWRQKGILFSGDLFAAGGYLVNLYDIERGYGLYNGWQELFASLDKVAALDPKLGCPSTGPVTHQPGGDCRTMRVRLRQAMRPTWRGLVRRPQKAPLRDLGILRQHSEGIFQSNNGGTIALFIDKQGRGLIVDPDICVWFDWATNCGLMNQSLNLLEKEAGLKTIDWALITHYHGDHMEYAPLLRERYGTKVMTSGPVADVLERPRDYGYPCVLDWYNFPYNSLKVDRRLRYGEVLDWHGTPVEVFHAPGHCWAHAAYCLPWEGKIVACTGDTFMYGGGGIAHGFPITWSDTAWPQRSPLSTYQKFAQLKIDLYLGGHGAYCYDADHSVPGEWILAIEEAIELARTAVYGDLQKAMTPPGYDARRPKAE